MVIDDRALTAKGRQLGMQFGMQLMLLNESLKRRGTDISQLRESSVDILKEFIEEKE